MNRRAGVSQDAAGERLPRERSDSVHSISEAAPKPQFVALHSRVGKRYQATIPELLTTAADAAELLDKKQALQQPRARYIPGRAQELGLELDKYLKLARSLREGATFDTQEQVMTLALQHLHRFDYNPTDAACSLYARHSMELPRAAAGGSQTVTKSMEEVKQWILAFYRCMRYTTIDENVLETMCDLHERAKDNADIIPATEAGVLARLVARILEWRKQCEEVKSKKVDRARLLQLLYQAEDMQVILPERQAVVSRLQAFDTALTQLKDALENTGSSKRRQNKKVELTELNKLFNAVMAPQLIFPEEDRFRETVDEAKVLKSTIDNMLANGKVSLPIVRDVLAKVELIPVNFEVEVEQFQIKLLSAQTWLAKARKCMPNRRATRQAGGGVTKKMHLDAIRALIDDAPCENSAEMFEMQDLLECADDWAVKVNEAIDGGADVTLDRLKEILEEAKDIPVIMDEQKFLEAEIDAREWCTTAASKLASRTSIEKIEELIKQANSIRERIHPKKQARWKPQIERDIHAAMDQARKWIHELRENLGVTAFDKLYATLSSYIPSSHSSKSSSAAQIDRAKKKSMDTISKLIDKSQALEIDVSSYTTPLNDLLLKGVEAQAEASAILMSIGYLSGTNPSDDTGIMEVDTMPRELGDLAQASSLLERVDAFPFTFEEGLSLASIVEGDKNWAARVRECIPPRQSRKKRLSNDSFSPDQLHELLKESKRLRFLFRDELRILSKELNDLTSWRAKAREIIDGKVSASIGAVIDRLRSFDLLVYGKLQKAKTKLRADNSMLDVPEHESRESTDTQASSVQSVKEETQSNGCAMDVDAEGSSQSQSPTQGSKQERVKPETACVENGSARRDAEAAAVPAANATRIAATSMEGGGLRVDSILTHVRMESGCMEKSTTEEDKKKAGESRTEKHGRDLLQLVLRMAEESFEAVNSLELREAQARQTVEELVLAGDQGEITENITDESVRALNGWKQQLLAVQKESDLLSVEAPEQQALSLIISLLEWLQGSRSIFYDELLPLRELVVKGNEIATKLNELKAKNVIEPTTLANLEQMLWPLPYLRAHENVVLEWTARVHKCVANKHAQVSELQALLDNGSGLLLEQGTFKIVMDEAKKARIWLSKLKKRLRVLMTKGIGRMSINAARALVDEGEDIAIDLPVFDYLKEHLELANDWEKRVLASGIETGQARIATLLALLNEYECARLVIDLDMHRDVLKSATERYCICRQPFDGLMIGCDHCDDWFHDSCIGMSKEKVEKVEHYTCPSCTIVHELAAVLSQVKVESERGNLWDMDEYAKTFERLQASAFRKVKREEKTVERTEMLLYSCTSQMNQLRARIDDMERARTRLAIKSVQKNGTLEASKSTSQSKSQSSTTALPSSTVASASTATATATAPSSVAVKANALLLAAAAASSAATASTNTNPTASSSAPAASTIANLNLTVLSRQQYPSLLISPMCTINNVLKNVPKLDAGTKSTTIINGMRSASGEGAQPEPKDVPHTAATTSISAAVASTSQATATTTAAASSSTTSAPAAMAQQPSTSALLSSTLMGSTEHLAAFVVAGGVEQQLAKVKNEHIETSKKVLELQSSLRLSRERLTHAQQALRELSDVFHARHRMLPYAQTWLEQTVSLLNTTTVLSRANIDFTTFLPPEYAAALEAMVRPPSEAASQPPCDPAEPSWSIDKLFPIVASVARVLRAVPWSQVVVSLLQERPSRREMRDAIAYASEYGLWDDKKVLAPLRSLIGRMDAWTSRAHKCLTKTGSKTQLASRLKGLMNEYSKLPLTSADVADPLNEYVTMLTEGGSQSRVHGALTLEAAEAAATQAIDDAMLGLAVAPGASGAPAFGMSTPKKQAARKRKLYPRKDKTPLRALKKGKKVRNGSSEVEMGSSSTPSPASIKPLNVESTTSAASVDGAAPLNAST
ncbi:hypothetical protein PsorP6_009381 [Peronosclerospora sorghi]|uniref:Uncharacterized protein n=1 Tax=Peronosclerospora sorghi TaxID=230839 RepID=A0ACC0VZ96_9STRA|nr:hypothetical protein PsorP6_009381 [Peronosclerospora sorghi]